MPSRNAKGAECVAMNSPTIFDHVSITSVSCRRSRSPRRCIIFGTSSAGNCQRSARILLSGKPRHSAITAARREGFINNYLATDAVLSNAEALTRMAHDCRGACVKRLFSLLGGWHNRHYSFRNSRSKLPQYFRRMWLGRIFSSVRYLATVRRAIGIPRSLRISTISLSLNGSLPSSRFTRSRIASFTLVLLNDSPVAVWYPGVKKYFISKVPCGVAIYLPETARL